MGLSDHFLNHTLCYRVAKLLSNNAMRRYKVAYQHIEESRNLVQLGHDDINTYAIIP